MRDGATPQCWQMGRSRRIMRESRSQVQSYPRAVESGRLSGGRLAPRLAAISAGHAPEWARLQRAHQRGGEVGIVVFYAAVVTARELRRRHPDHNLPGK